MYPILPPFEDRRIDDIEKEPGFATYAWEPPLCPWCGQWLRPVDMRPVGLPFQATNACPFYHGLLAFSQTRWVDVRPPKTVLGGDGAWWSSISIQELRLVAAEC